MKKEIKKTIVDCGGIKEPKLTTELVFILDRSGSMSRLEADTIGGFNSMIEKQKKLDGEWADNMTKLYNEFYRRGR